MSDTYFEIANADDIIRLEPISFIYPNAPLDWDRNWIKTNVILKCGVFTGKFVLEFMTMDFENFKRQLKNLYTNFNATATFEPLEQQLVLIIKGDGLGHFEVDCEATPESHLGHTLTFSISFDQTEIKELIRQLDKVTKSFPIDGDFLIQNE